MLGRLVGGAKIDPVTRPEPAVYVGSPEGRKWSVNQIQIEVSVAHCRVTVTDGTLCEYQ